MIAAFGGMQRSHPFAIGYVLSALLVGLVGGASLQSGQVAGIGAALLAAGAAVSCLVVRWKPGYEAPAWQLIPVALIANPVMLTALGFIASDAECLVGANKGWQCLGAAMAASVAIACLPPPVAGWLWRSVKRWRALHR